MAYLNILLVSAGSVIALFLLTKLMGNRQMSQLSMFDYIIGITIGSIAAEMATALEGDFIMPLLAMVVYGVLAFLLTKLSEKSLKCRRIISGETRILLDGGKLYRDNFKKGHVDITEFLCLCRNSGYFNISDLQTAILEQNGKISFLPKSAKRPVNPQDLNLTPEVEKPCITIITDGEILYDNLKFSGNTEEWLLNELKAQGVPSAEKVFLAFADADNTLSVYLNIEKPQSRDMFE